MSPSAKATSIAAKASLAARTAPASAVTADTRPSNSARSMASARSAAVAILLSSSASSTVENRMAPAMVWRWMNSALWGGTRQVSPTCDVTSMKKPRKLLCLILRARMSVRST